MTLEQFAPVAHLIAWGAIAAAAGVGGVAGAIIGLRLTRTKETS